MQMLSSGSSAWAAWPWPTGPPGSGAVARSRVYGSKFGAWTREMTRNTSVMAEPCYTKHRTHQAAILTSDTGSSVALFTVASQNKIVLWW